MSECNSTKKEEFKEILQNEWKLLKDESKRISKTIKKLKYKESNMKCFESLWDIKDEIIEKIEKLYKEYPDLFQ